MNQLAIDLPRCILPPENTQCLSLLIAMKQGRRFTVSSALHELGIYALSQRCGELRRDYGLADQVQDSEGERQEI